MQTHIAGDRPFVQVVQYLDWLVNKPDSSSLVVDSLAISTSTTLAHVVLTLDDGSNRVGTCETGAMGTTAPTLDWSQCPSLTSLWISGSPTTFPSIQAAKPYLANYVFMPPSLPGGYELVRVELPHTAEEAAGSPFMTTAMYTNPVGSLLTLAEQPGGVSGPALAGMARCNRVSTVPKPNGGAPIIIGNERDGSQPTVHCAAWGDKATSFFLTSESADLSSIEQAVGAIERLQESS